MDIVHTEHISKDKELMMSTQYCKIMIIPIVEPWENLKKCVQELVEIALEQTEKDPAEEYRRFLHDGVPLHRVLSYDTDPKNCKALSLIQGPVLDTDPNTWAKSWQAWWYEVAVCNRYEIEGEISLLVSPAEKYDSIIRVLGESSKRNNTAHTSCTRCQRELGVLKTLWVTANGTWCHHCFRGKECLAKGVLRWSFLDPQDLAPPAVDETLLMLYEEKGKKLWSSVKQHGWYIPGQTTYYDGVFFSVVCSIWWTPNNEKTTTIHLANGRIIKYGARYPCPPPQQQSSARSVKEPRQSINNSTSSETSSVAFTGTAEEFLNEPWQHDHNQYDGPIPHDKRYKKERAERKRRHKSRQHLRDSMNPKPKSHATAHYFTEETPECTSGDLRELLIRKYYSRQTTETFNVSSPESEDMIEPETGVLGRTPQDRYTS